MKKIICRNLITALILGAVLSSCSNVADTFDDQLVDSRAVKKNQTIDWANVPLIGRGSKGNGSIKVTYDSNYVYLKIDEPKKIVNYNIFINADGKSNSGYQAAVYWTKSGADFLVSNGGLYRSTGTGWNWEQTSGDFSCLYGNKAVDLKISFATLGIRSSEINKLSFAYISYSSGWDTEATVVPMKGTDFACVHQKYDVTEGMIIPAYISLSENDSWNILAYGANLMKANKNSKKDYFVTVNSENNGPFSKASDWDLAAVKFDAIRNNGGRIFGYVHTCDDAINNPLKFRTIESVEADIKAWVDGYPQLDGIWLDEFYPRYEIASNTDTKPTYPNGKKYAPNQTDIYNADWDYWYPLNPAGGYYDQLCSWIRKTYPTLRIIGNAGGDLWSNQLDYGYLVDILVVFEQTYSEAVNGNWAKLHSANQGHADKKLSLIHGNSVDLYGSIKASFDNNMSHVYVTDRIYSNNVWGGLPSYFYTEIEQMGNF